ncbi:MAG: septum formation initiator family protein [Fimbriimonadia bacterium]
MARKRKQGRVNWLALGLVATMLLCIGAIAWNSRRPWQLWISERQRAATLRAEVAQIERENREMEARLKQLDSPAGLETEARRQGWVKPGEQIISLPESRPDKDKD